MIDSTPPIPSSILERLYRKLPSVHERIDRLADKDKLHHVLHAAYRPAEKTLAAGRKKFVKLTGVQPETDASVIPQLLKLKNLIQLQNIDRLVKPDPRIYIHQAKAVSFDDIKTLGRSPIESQIQNKLTAIDLKQNPQQLIDDLSTYGFAIIDTENTQKETIAQAFTTAQNYLTRTELSDKKLLSLDDPSTDVRYRAARTPEQQDNGYRPIEDIVAQRPCIFDEQYSDSWDKAKASDLKHAFQDIAHLLEAKSQEILEHVAKLLQLSPNFFEDFGYETDQSTVRLIHCISHQEQTQGSSKYFDSTTKAATPRREEPNDSCVGIHTDWGLITLLPTATAAGLEFWYNDAENNGQNSGWVQLRSKPGQLIVMPGNVAEIISGGRLKSIPHRVISKGERFSLAYFTEVKKDTDIDKVKQELIKQSSIDATKVSLFEDEVRPYLTSPDQALTGENYLLYMKHRNTKGLNGKTVDYAKTKGLFLKNS